MDRPEPDRPGAGHPHRILRRRFRRGLRGDHRDQEGLGFGRIHHTEVIRRVRGRCDRLRDDVVRDAVHTARRQLGGDPRMGHAHGRREGSIRR